MEPQTYQSLAARTLIDKPDQPLTAAEIKLVCKVLMAICELTSVLETVKKKVFHKHQLNWDIDELIDEHLGYAMENLAETQFTHDIPEALSDKTTMLLWTITGLVGEAGEVADALMPILKEAAQADDYSPQLLAEFAKELGDQQWYANGIATVLGLSMNDIQSGNIAKLESRYPQGFSSEASKNRK